MYSASKPNLHIQVYLSVLYKCTCIQILKFHGIIFMLSKIYSIFKSFLFFIFLNDSLSWYNDPVWKHLPRRIQRSVQINNLTPNILQLLHPNSYSLTNYYNQQKTKNINNFIVWLLLTAAKCQNWGYFCPQKFNVEKQVQELYLRNTSVQLEESRNTSQSKQHFTKTCTGTNKANQWTSKKCLVWNDFLERWNLQPLV